MATLGVASSIGTEIACSCWGSGGRRKGTNSSSCLDFLSSSLAFHALRIPKAAIAYTNSDTLPMIFSPSSVSSELSIALLRKSVLAVLFDQVNVFLLQVYQEKGGKTS